MPTKVLFIQPVFRAASFWNYTDAAALTGAKYPTPPLGLITVAALLPQDWEARLVDCNVAELRDADILWADLVMMGSMLPNKLDCLDLINRCKGLGVPVAVGGPDPTADPDFYKAADFLVLGEVEDIIGDFVADFVAGVPSGRYVAERGKVDVSKTPVPRYDLLDMKAYLEMSVQFSRGCPFLCEFCDIIELFGRVPRAKPTENVLRELQAIYDLGFRGSVQIVDDNLIGNKKAVKQFLPQLIDWQKERGYPFLFSTEASINLADDPELLGMMRDACFVAVFIGIESPDPEVLLKMSKKQNLKREIAENVARIQQYGMFVVGGFIIGMDGEKPGVGEAIADLVEEAAIPIAMVGLLFALPETRLVRRLEAEGRLDDWSVDPTLGDQCTGGLNFITERPRAEILADYKSCVERLYDKEAFFARVRKSVERINASGINGNVTRGRWLSDSRETVLALWNITSRHPDFRGVFWKTLWFTIRNNPRAVGHMMRQAGIFAHLGPYSRFILSVMETRIEEERQAATAGPPAVAQAAVAPGPEAELTVT